MSWFNSKTALPPGTCLLHGPHAGLVCPTCSTAGTLANVPMVKVKCPSCPFAHGCGKCGWRRV